MTSSTSLLKIIAFAALPLLASQSLAVVRAKAGAIGWQCENAPSAVDVTDSMRRLS